MIAPSQENAISEPRGGRTLWWTAVIVVGLCFFFPDHDLRTSTQEAYALAADDMAIAVQAGDAGRRIAFPVIAALGIFCLLNRRPRQESPLSVMSRTHDRDGAGTLPPAAWLILAYLAWCGLSTVWSIDPSMTIRRFTILTCCFLGALGLGRAFDVRQLVALALAVCTGYLVLGLVAEAALGTLRPFSPDYRFAGTVHPNTQAMILSALCLSAFCLARSVERGKMLLYGLFAVGFVFLVLTKSRTSCGTLLMGLTAAWWLQIPRRTWLLTTVGVAWAVLTAVLLGSMLNVNVDRDLGDVLLMGRRDEAGTLTGRIPLWNELALYVTQRPLVGYGYDSFWTPQHIHEVSTRLQWAIHEAHNSYLDAVLGVGMVGAGLGLLIAGIGVLTAARRYLAYGEPAYVFFLALFVIGLVEGLMGSGMLLPIFVPFLAGCGLMHLVFWSAASRPVAQPASALQRSMEPNGAAALALPVRSRLVEGYHKP